MSFLHIVAALLVCAAGRAAVISATVDGFAPAERRVLDSAIAYWERAILDPVTFNVSFQMLDLPGDQLGASSGFAQDPAGLPAGGSIEIDDRSDSVIPWFVDPTPERNEEYRPGFNEWDFQGRRPGPAGENYDLLTVLDHELAHVLGFSMSYTLFAAHVHPSDYDLRTYDGTSVTAVLAPEYGGTHLSDAIHPYDLMNEFQSRGERLLPSDLDFAILSDAFGYAIERPAPAAVPEPSSVGLAAAASLALLACRMRRPKGGADAAESAAVTRSGAC